MARCTRCGADIDSAAWCSSCGLMQPTAPVDPASAAASFPDPTTPDDSAVWRNALVLSLAITVGGGLLLFSDPVAEFGWSLWRAFDGLPHQITHPRAWFYLGPAIVFGLAAGVPLGLFFGAARANPSKAMLGPIGALLLWPVLVAVHALGTLLWFGFETDRPSLFLDTLTDQPSYLHAPLIVIITVIVVSSFSEVNERRH
ncbi:MAG: hypothetical protein ACRBI6_14030 [Acidimicrobiales bacterium]